MPQLQGAFGAGPGRMPDLRQGAAHPAIDLDPAAPVALRPSLPWPAGTGFPVDAAQYRRPHDPALPDGAADGQCADTISKRQAHRSVAGGLLYVRLAGFSPAGLAAGLVENLYPGDRLRTHGRRFAFRHL